MTTLFNMRPDIGGRNGFGVEFADDGQRTTLVAGVEQHFTVPSTYKVWVAIFLFESGSRVWVGKNITVTVPPNSFTASTADIIPAARVVRGGDVLSFITNDTTAEIKVSLYAVQR